MPTPRPVRAFDYPHTLGEFLAESVVLRGSAEVTEGGAGALLHRLGRVYVSPDFVFPAPEDGPGFVIRYRVEKVGGVGPWVPTTP